MSVENQPESQTKNKLSRRDFLKVLAATGASSILASRPKIASFAQELTPESPQVDWESYDLVNPNNPDNPDERILYFRNGKIRDSVFYGGETEKLSSFAQHLNEFRLNNDGSHPFTSDNILTFFKTEEIEVDGQQISGFKLNLINTVLNQEGKEVRILEGNAMGHLFHLNETALAQQLAKFVEPVNTSADELKKEVPETSNQTQPRSSESQLSKEFGNLEPDEQIKVGVAAVTILALIGSAIKTRLKGNQGVKVSPEVNKFRAGLLRKHAIDQVETLINVPEISNRRRRATGNRVDHYPGLHSGAKSQRTGATYPRRIRKAIEDLQKAKTQEEAEEAEMDYTVAFFDRERSKQKGALIKPEKLVTESRNLLNETQIDDSTNQRRIREKLQEALTGVVKDTLDQFI
jgi:hypothetical protein